MQRLSTALQFLPHYATGTKRTIFNADKCISEQTEEEIKEEIMTKDSWAEDNVENVYKFPGGNTFKITFKQTATAKKGSASRTPCILPLNITTPNKTRRIHPYKHMPPML